MSNWRAETAENALRIVMIAVEEFEIGGQSAEVCCSQRSGVVEMVRASAVFSPTRSPTLSVCSINGSISNTIKVFLTIGTASRCDARKDFFAADSKRSERLVAQLVLCNLFVP